MRALHFLLAVLTLSIAPTAGAQHLPQYYEITEIALPVQTETRAVAINDQQQAVFTWFNSSNEPRSGIFNGNTGTIGVLDLGGFPGGAMTEAQGINNAGDVVGYASHPSSYTRHAFVYRNGVFSALGILPGAWQSGAFDISDAGTAVGYSEFPTVAVRFAGGGVTQLSTVYGHATRINHFGVASGYAVAADGLIHAALFENGAVIDVGPANSYSFATGINDSGDVTFYVQDSPNRSMRSYLRASWGALTDLGTLPGLPSTISAGINNYGMVVGGSALDNYSANERAFVYGDCRIVDLTHMIDPASPLQPYVTLLEGRDINNNGWIVATGLDARDTNLYVPRAYVLKPVGPPTNICT